MTKIKQRWQNYSKREQLIFFPRRLGIAWADSEPGALLPRSKIISIKAHKTYTAPSGISPRYCNNKSESAVCRRNDHRNTHCQLIGRCMKVHIRKI